LLRTVFHLFQFSLSYLLMLVVMTYNIGLFVAVVFGSSLAFYFFNVSTDIDHADCH